MRSREDYTRIVLVALVLSIGILVAFQIYLLREPARIADVLAADQSAQIASGEKLFADNCATCHGKLGEGDMGPALNSKKFLKSTDDGVIFSLVGSGVPGTGMPSWSQTHGGPFTDEQIRDVVSFVRHWEATAPDIVQVSPTPDAAKGEAIFKATCYACHGVNGEGTDRAPALNSPTLLAQFNDAWFHQTIADGRPSKGMPTWGLVLSPAQISSVVAYIRSWQSSPPVAAAATPTTPTPQVQATAEVTPTVEIARPSNGNLTPGAAITQNLVGNSTSGEKIFVDNCQKCHGEQGKGGIDNAGSTDGTVPPLNPIDDTLVSQDLKVFATNVDLFIEHGSTPEGDNPKLVMDAWGDKGKLTPQQIADVITYVMGLNGATTTSATPVSTAAATETPAADIARPSNGNLTPGAAVNLVGNATSGETIFVSNCQKCHGEQGKGGINNAGSTDGTVPPLNPIDDTLVSQDLKVFATNVDLFIEHGSTPEGDNPKLVMDAWGDKAKLTPQQIADVITYVMGLNGATVSSATPAPTVVATETPAGDIARPSNGNLTPGPAVNLVGDAKSGETVFVGNCQKCHGEQGKGGIDNAGSTDGTVPPLNPIDDTLVSQDLKTFATNIDLFIEHGSTPEGDNPKLVMDAWGDKAKLTPQQIADVITYVMGLNGATVSSATPAPTVVATETPAADIARPSNGNLTPGPAVNLVGDAKSGETVFVGNCQKCHGEQGKGGIDNAGSTDGTVPPLNPIDDTLVSQDLKTFATNIDLFIEHGSTPEGDNPKLVMDAWGDKAKLTPQQIADVIAYLIELNKQ